MSHDPLQRKLAVALLLLRLSVGLVFFMWTIDKFLNPTHAAKVYETFYMIPSLSSVASYVVGGLQCLIVLAFLMGMFKTLSYLAVLLIHTVSTLSTYAKYLDPWSDTNLLFFAAIPMLAACWALWSLREYDVIASVDAARKRAT